MNEIEKVIGYTFTNKDLLVESLTHPSCYNSKGKSPKNYERLEFLGDSVLNLVITKYLIETYPKESEGDLAKRRSVLVSGHTLSKIALNIQLGSFIIMAEGEELTGGRDNSSNLENSLEAVIGAVYLDGGFIEAQKIILCHWHSFAKDMVEIPFNPKTKLQEWSQARNRGIPQYVVLNSSGPAHYPLFEIEVRVSGGKAVSATGNSKKEAESNAAKLLLNEIEQSEKNCEN